MPELMVGYNLDIYSTNDIQESQETIMMPDGEEIWYNINEIHERQINNINDLYK